MPTNSRKDISHKHNREKRKNTLNLQYSNCDGCLVRNNERRSGLNQGDWVVMGKRSISLGLPFFCFKNCFLYTVPSKCLSKKSRSSNLSLYRKILKNRSKFHFPSFQINSFIHIL